MTMQNTRTKDRAMKCFPVCFQNSASLLEKNVTIGNRARERKLQQESRENNKSMFRRSAVRRNAFGSSSRAQYEETYRENVKMRERVYKKDGSYDFMGIFAYLYDKSFYTIGGTLTIVGGLIAYHYLVLWATGKYTDHNQKLFDEREKFLRASGKLKSEKHLVLPLRQIEDPDILNVPCPTAIDMETGEPKKMISRSFLNDDEDDQMVNPLHAERKFHR